MLKHRVGVRGVSVEIGVEMVRGQGARGERGWGVLRSEGVKGVFGSTHLRRDLGRELQHGGERAASCRLLLLVNYGQVPLTAEVHVAAGIGACTI